MTDLFAVKCPCIINPKLPSLPSGSIKGLLFIQTKFLQPDQRRWIIKLKTWKTDQWLFVVFFKKNVDNDKWPGQVGSAVPEVKERVGKSSLKFGEGSGLRGH